MVYAFEMKTTLEIPDLLFRKVKATAAARGQTLKQLVNGALRDVLSEAEKAPQPGWMRLFGSMKEHSVELRRIDARIEEEFGGIDPEAWK